MKYEIFADGEKVAEVEAAGLAKARTEASKLGYRFCEVREIRRMLPGETEYGKFLDWRIACRNTNADWRSAAWHEKTDLEADRDALPEYPLTAEETEAAREYARFLGEVILRDFDSARR